MSCDDLITLLARVPAETRLYPLAQKVLQRLLADPSGRVVVGDPYPSEHYQFIYQRRLDRLLERGLALPSGLAETVARFNRCQGTIGGGYAEFGDDLVYFFTNEAGHLVGLVW